jgi:glycosyltransferase involved in cell wall biosynthesis
MNILIITSSHPHKNAGVVALDLYRSLKKINGYDLKIITKPYDKFANPDFLSYDSKIFHYSSKVHRKFKILFKKLKLYKPLLSKTNRNYAIQQYDHTKTPISSKKFLRKVGFTPDAIIVLFNVGFLSYKNLYELNKITKAPILLYMMDMAPLTGGCHYAWNCKGYLKQCGKCPAYNSGKEDDQSRRNMEFKKRYIKNSKIIPVSASYWQTNQLVSSYLFADSFKFKILSPTNDELFKPGDSSAAKRKFGMESSRKVIFIGSANIQNKRKGTNEALKALKLLYEQLSEKERTNIVLLIAGRNSKIMEQVKFKKNFAGYLTHEKLVLAYQASTVFLNSSIEDSGPTMINQAIMSGTPVVAFEMGVAPDLVINGKTGYMAKLNDCADLANGLLSIIKLNGKEYDEYSKNCRRIAMEKCSHQVVGREFHKLLIEVVK